MNIRMTSFAAMAILATSMFACSKEQPPTSPAPAPSSAPTPVATETASAEPATAPGRKLKKEGEMCGGIAGFRCEEGLECVTPPPMYPDKAGSCKKK